jgi:hypothetical protein
MSGVRVFVVDPVVYENLKQGLKRFSRVWITDQYGRDKRVVERAGELFEDETNAKVVRSTDMGNVINDPPQMRELVNYAKLLRTYGRPVCVHESLYVFRGGPDIIIYDRDHDSILAMHKLPHPHPTSAL